MQKYHRESYLGLASRLVGWEAHCLIIYPEMPNISNIHYSLRV